MLSNIIVELSAPIYWQAVTCWDIYAVITWVDGALKLESSNFNISSYRVLSSHGVSLKFLMDPPLPNDYRFVRKASAIIFLLHYPRFIPMTWLNVNLTPMQEQMWRIEFMDLLCVYGNVNQVRSREIIYVAIHYYLYYLQRTTYIVCW